VLIFVQTYFTPLTFEIIMRKADIVGCIAEKTGIPKVDILVALEAFFREVKTSLEEGEPVYVRGFGSFILKKRAAKIGRNIKKNIAVEIPEHFIPAFKPAKEFILSIKESKHELVAHEDADFAETE
jgi:DNA-binding protein HU-beta